MRFADGEPRYDSRRSAVITPTAAVASSQPLATQAGISVLAAGGSAADAAVAVAAALQVTQPCSTGLGGDAFALYHDGAGVHAYNGSGRCPRELTLSRARDASNDRHLPPDHAYTVTVPGALDCWLAVHQRFGRLPLERVLAPAVALAAEGFPVAPHTARWWSRGAERQLASRAHGGELMRDGHAPAAGERFVNPGLAAVLGAIAAEGRSVFYDGWIAGRIVDAVREEGGALSRDDLAAHQGEWVAPIAAPYGDHLVWECPPNGQGIAALIALRIYSHLAPADAQERLHAKVESMRLAFADAHRHLGDPAWSAVPVEELLADRYTASRASLIGERRADVTAGEPVEAGTDTVYFAVVDASGNGCSFINSNYMGFGTGIVPRGCGFTLQNRGHGFVLDEGHPNCLEPGKRPFHTIIPALLTDRSGELEAVFGVMGGPMQPQGHLQVVTALVDDALDPQAAMDLPRFQVERGEPEADLLLESGMDESIYAGMERRGHRVRRIEGSEREIMGLGQVIARAGDAWWSGSDGRGDGCAGGF